MNAVDTNVLVYAHRRESRFHDMARDLLKNLASGDPRWAIPWPCVYEFFSVVTNPKIWKEQATKPEAACAQINAWRNSPSVVLLSETRDMMETLIPMLSQPRIRGAVVHDARIASLCLVHGVEVLFSKDRDFQLFPTLRVKDPFGSITK